MDCTGERVIEEEYRKNERMYLVYLFHLATYRFAVPFVRNKSILDFGCGTGYGSHFLSQYCTHVTAIDISHEAIKYGESNYKAANLEFKKVSPIEHGRLPFEDKTFETVVSFQVLEHLADLQKYFDEIWRVLKDDGVLVLATPDRSTRLFKGQKPWNVFHLHEYRPGELADKMQMRFESIKLFGMSARDDLLAGELKRTARMKILTYPLTFPGIPEPVRQMALKLLKKIQALVPQKGTSGGGALKFNFDVEDIYISPQANPSINIIIVANKRLA